MIFCWIAPSKGWDGSLAVFDHLGLFLQCVERAFWASREELTQQTLEDSYPLRQLRRDRKRDAKGNLSAREARAVVLV